MVIIWRWEGPTGLVVCLAVEEVLSRTTVPTSSPESRAVMTASQSRAAQPLAVEVQLASHSRPGLRHASSKTPDIPIQAACPCRDLTLLDCVCPLLHVAVDTSLLRHTT